MPFSLKLLAACIQENPNTKKLLELLQAEVPWHVFWTTKQKYNSYIYVLFYFSKFFWDNIKIIPFSCSNDLWLTA